MDEISLCPKTFVIKYSLSSCAERILYYKNYGYTLLYWKNKKKLLSWGNFPLSFIHYDNYITDLSLLLFFYPLLYVTGNVMYIYIWTNVFLQPVDSFDGSRPCSRRRLVSVPVSSINLRPPICQKPWRVYNDIATRRFANALFIAVKFLFI